MIRSCSTCAASPDRASRPGMIGLVAAVIVVILALWAVGLYNRLVGLRNQTQNGWKQIDVQLKRRHDLIPNLVNTVKGQMDFEQGTLKAVMEARAKAMGATGPADAGQKEGELIAGRRPVLRGRRELPAAQVEREREDAAGRAVVHGEQDRLRAPVLQRHRDEVQHRARDVPRRTCSPRSSASQPAELFTITDDADRAVPVVELSTRADARRQPPPRLTSLRDRHRP